MSFNIWIWRVFGAFGLCLAFWMASAAQSSAFTVFSKGVSYEVEIVALERGTSFNDANAGGALTASPWFGDFALARDVAAALPSALLETGTEVFLPYRYSLAGLTVNSVVATGAGKHLDLFRNRNESRIPLFDGTLTQSQAWAVGTAKSAPEIDGSNLAQALFVLLAFALLRGRRHTAWARWSKRLPGASAASTIP